MWKLVIEDDEGKRTVVPLTRDVYTVGRKEGNTIRLTERNVSREHARIRKLNGATPPPPPTMALPYTLEDLQSYNGVFVNGLRVAGVHELSHGDLIQIGDYRMILQDEAVAEEAPTPPPPTTEADHKSTLPTGAMQRGSLLLERPNRMVMLAGPTPGMEYPMERERITIGRAEDCTISINHNSVSRLHCEVHSLGEGRFEIVDKASSNGVRVNGRELKRGIIEAGDIIELGDVRFRFVGAGQVFLPGVNDSQQLMAIGDRVAEGSMRPRTGGIAGFIAAGAVVAMVLVLGVWFFLHRQKTHDVVSPDTPAAKEAVILANAKKQCQDKNECEGAHEMLMASISDGSPLRLSPDFKYIETRWADAVLEHAQTETNEIKKRNLLNLVASSTTVDEDRRRIAQTRLNELNAIATNITPSNTAPTIAPTNTTPPSATTTPTPSNTVVPHPTATVTHTATATTTTATTKPPVKTPLDRASDMYKAGDLAGARNILEGRVFGHTATPEEVKLLKGICKEQSDKVCRDKITQMYP
jgi:pSer/pThr/pTyr-binding forkhead associated (FHA) protein